MAYERTWAEIDHTAATENFNALRACAGSAAICCTVKANAYGHGALSLSHLYERLGAKHLAVATCEEGRELRAGGIRLPILILGYTPPSRAMQLSRDRLTQCVFSLAYARALSAAAVSAGVTVYIHLKLDTGMGRIGFRYDGQGEDSLAGALAVLSLPALCTRGIFTHFSSADEGNGGNAVTITQLGRFQDMAAKIDAHCTVPPLRHAANSAALVSCPQSRLDMVRLGIALYGILPSANITYPVSLTPVMTLKTLIIHIKNLPRGATVGYGCIYRAPSQVRLATLPVGYADGVGRRWEEAHISFLVRGTLCPLVGRVSMDQCVVDVTAVPGAAVGDAVTLFGTYPAPTVSQIATAVGTIPYELLTAVGERVTRITK